MLVVVTPETAEEINIRFAYTNYLNGDFDKSLKYFGNYFSANDKNAGAYLYASYAAEELYKETGSTSYKELSKKYAKQAYQLDNSNEHIKKQYEGTDL